MADKFHGGLSKENIERSLQPFNIYKPSEPSKELNVRDIDLDNMTYEEAAFIKKNY